MLSVFLVELLLSLVVAALLFSLLYLSFSVDVGAVLWFEWAPAPQSNRYLNGFPQLTHDS